MQQSQTNENLLWRGGGWGRRMPHARLKDGKRWACSRNKGELGLAGA